MFVPLVLGKASVVPGEGGGAVACVASECTYFVCTYVVSLSCSHETILQHHSGTECIFARPMINEQQSVPSSFAIKDKTFREQFAFEIEGGWRGSALC